jgi:hypothetical protein
LVSQVCQTVAKNIGKAGRLDENAFQVLEDRALPVGLKIDMTAFAFSQYEPCAAQEAQFPLDGAHAQPGCADNLSKVESLVGV